MVFSGKSTSYNTHEHSMHGGPGEEEETQGDCVMTSDSVARYLKKQYSSSC